MSQPTVGVLLDDGTDTFPHDITEHVRMINGITIRAGRQDEQSQITPSQLNLTLENIGGEFALGSTVLATPSVIVLNQKIRVRLSFLPNGTFDDGVTGWSGGNSALAAVGTPVRSGDGALRMTAIAAADMSAFTPTGTSGMPVTPGTKYKLEGWFRAATATRACFVRARFYDAGGALLSTIVSSDVTNSTSAWTKASTDATAPAGAAFASISAVVKSPAAGEQHYVDDAWFGVNRFTGYVQEWPVAWPSGDDTFSTVTITATDALARLGRIPARAPLAEAMLLAGATLVWPLTDGTPVGTPGMVGPVCWPVGPAASSVGPLRMRGDSDGYPDPFPSFASTPVANDNGSILTFGQSVTFPNPYQLGIITGGDTDTATGPGTPMTDDFSMSFIFKSEAGGAGNLYQLGDKLSPSQDAVMFGSNNSQLAVYLFVTSVVEAYVESAVDAFDGQWHLATAVITNSGKTVTLYFDTLAGVADTGSSSPSGDLDAVKCGSVINLGVAVGYFAFFPFALTQATHLELHEIAFGDAGFRSDEVIARWAEIAGVPFSAVDSGSQNVPTFGSSDIGAAMAAVMEAEGGRLYVDGSGTLTFESRAYPLAAVYADTPALTVDVDQLNPDATFSADPQRLINRAAVTRTGGGTVTVEDTASIAQNGVYGAAKSVQVMDDSQAGNLAGFLVWQNSEAGPRLAGAKLDLLTQDLEIQQAFLANLMGAWLRLDGLPAQSPTGATADLYIEGWTETISATDWSLQINTSPKKATPTTFWRLDDTAFELDNNARLFY